MWWLATQILVFIVIAALLGLLLGYVIWGWRRGSGAGGADAERIATLEAELERANLACDSQEQEIAQLRANAEGTDAGDLAAELSNCQAERQRLEDDLAALRRERDEAVAAKDEAAGELESLRNTAADTFGEDTLRAELNATRAARDELQRQLDAGGAAHDADIEKLRQDLADCAAARAELEAELAALRAEQADAAAEAAPAAPPPASLLTERPEEVDDLKRIKGVGPVMEGILNDKGVYLFHQVANFSPADVAWVNDAIEAFPGRIERDEWVRQAQEFYLEKYGKRHDAD